jgi:hypothetical protein
VEENLIMFVVQEAVVLEVEVTACTLLMKMVEQVLLDRVMTAVTQIMTFPLALEAVVAVLLLLVLLHQELLLVMVEMD